MIRKSRLDNSKLRAIWEKISPNFTLHYISSFLSFPLLIFEPFPPALISIHKRFLSFFLFFPLSLHHIAALPSYARFLFSFFSYESKSFLPSFL